MLRPIAENIYRSLFRLDLLTSGREPIWVGLQNYWDVLTGPFFWEATAKTLFFTLLPTFFELLIALALGMLLQKAFRGRGLLQSLLLIPWAVPTLVSAFAWVFMVHPRVGVINQWLTALGVLNEPRVWLAERGGAMLVLLVALTWKGLPFVLVVILAGFRQIPPEQYEAASVDGAAWWQSLWYVTLPNLKRVIAIALILRIIWYFSLFDFIWLLTKGGPIHATETLAVEIWIQTFRLFRWGDASTVAVLMSLILTIFIILFFIVTREEE